ncbi:ferrichrome ABC transporter substrate-binding protein [Enterococcus villorum]|uniref:Ferrichrome ABC transporter substrate-binding protein n=2 Tax=Enterococcus villorum TaxID=112904 RepID=A0A1V8YBX2_9ENTE|nr:iron-hydroxamate ABC transporter substrate-binding protein [Enterococcus villorum]EOH87585.1 ABC transporter periplasmic substrate-binding protein [Enterococcus villorum ATCC 700913]EOW77696.1 ABC transporter periplasmic substrate-binding protein [Enterococcus villorum ATCC 700913]OQO70113.1 ferrichrome ABC transporter substrate-binding protein [Enterococcus villorum]OQO76247.1 ferrichrome ABC transporter substrate-binding protein [Enterococcus villorum]GEL91399.1 ferrichrome ABC transporte
MKSKKKLFTIALSILLISFISACSSSTTTNSSNSQATTGTHTVTDTLGHKVAIPNNPKRIIGSYLEDYLVALGEKPVAQWTVGSGSIQHYLQKELKNVPTISYDLPYEKVLSFEPDLLLISSSATVEGGKYEQYSKIAPTYVVKNGNDVTWEEQLKDVAKALNKEKEAEKIITDYQNEVKETRKELANKINNKTAAVLWVTNNSAFMVSDTRSSGRIIYDDLQFGIPNLVAEVSKNATSDWSAVSSEKLAQLDADYIILVNSDEKAAMFNEATWQNLKAVKENHVLEFGPESSWLYNGPIASQNMVKDIKNQLN